MAQQGSSVQRFEDLDIGALAVRTVTTVVKRRPVSVSMWVVGLLLAAFAKGFAVDETTFQVYQLSLQHANEVERKELGRALNAYHRADERYRNAKGWFSCDDRCMKEYDKSMMAKAEVDRVQRHRDELLREARREVGIWSTFGVQDVRDAFWSAWKSGKDWAARYTMMDAIFMMMPGGREETAVSMILKIVMQYIINLTMGLIGSFFFFVYNVYSLIVSYGEPLLSGVSFFLLVLVAGIATVGSYLCAIYGTVVGGGVYLVKQAAKQQAMENEQRRRPQQVQWGTGRPGGFGPGAGMHRRPHMD